MSIHFSLCLCPSTESRGGRWQENILLIPVPILCDFVTVNMLASCVHQKTNRRHTIQWCGFLLPSKNKTETWAEDVCTEKEKDIVLSYSFNLKKSQSLSSVPMLLQPCYKNKTHPPLFFSSNFWMEKRFPYPTLSLYRICCQNLKKVHYIFSQIPATKNVGCYALPEFWIYCVKTHRRAAHWGHRQEKIWWWKRGDWLVSGLEEEPGNFQITVVPETLMLDL